MCRINLPVLILCVSLHQTIPNRIVDVESIEHVNQFNVLAISQYWPVTGCKKKKVNPKSECNYPNKKLRWLVHGIWPVNVEFCNESWPYEPEQIKSIKGELEQAWIGLIKGEDSNVIWEIEWRKHGTCAAELEEFNSQFKYFSKGIEWNQKYSILDMLEAAQIFPDDTKEFTPEQFVNAVKSKTKMNPMVVCCDEIDIDGVLYLGEIRLCFDKQLSLIDCGIVVDQSCYQSEGIIYPANA